tara:strand:+ start:300 stop:536 length:237 start_codon:yes stop_codon:yes gene_type:complete
MKLTTKLLKEMIQQEMSNMQYGGDVFDAPPAEQTKYFKAPKDGNGPKVEIDKAEYDELVEMGGSQQDDFETGDMTVFI